MPADTMTTDSLLYIAEVFVGDTVTFCGRAKLPNDVLTTETFMVSDSVGSAEICVEMAAPIDIEAGEIATGDAVVVRGLLHEKRVTAQDLDAKAHETDSLSAAGVITDSMRQKTLNAIEAKKAYMHFKGQTYYSVFSIQGAQVTVL